MGKSSSFSCRVINETRLPILCRDRYKEILMAPFHGCDRDAPSSVEGGRWRSCSEAAAPLAMLPAQSVSAEWAAELGVSSGLPWTHCAERISPEARGPCHHRCSKAQRSRSTGHAWPLNTCAPPAHLSLDCFSLTALTVSDKLSIAGKCNTVFLHLGKKCFMLSCILSSWCPKGGEQVVLYQLPCETGLCTSGTVVTGGRVGRHFFRW